MIKTTDGTLWEFACLFMRHKLPLHAIKCLEVICRSESQSDAIIKLKAHIFLAETYGSLVIENRDDNKFSDGETRKTDRCEECVSYAEKQLQRDARRGVKLSKEWKSRLYRAKYFSGSLSNKSSSASQLSNLCEAILECSTKNHKKEKIISVYQDFFHNALKEMLIRLYDAMLTQKTTKSAFESHLRCVLSKLDNVPDMKLQIWLMIVNYHLKISTSFGTSGEALEILDRTNQLISLTPASQQAEPSDWRKFQLYQRILSCFVLSSSGDYNQANNILRESKAILSSDNSVNRVWPVTDEFSTLVLELLEVSLLAKSNSILATKICADVIHRAQKATADSASRNKIAPGLLGIFFDLLHLYCELLFRQCRFSAVCLTIHQTLQIFLLYQPFLLKGSTYSYITSRIYTSIAKYLILIGCKSGAQTALKRVIECHLLPLDNYSDAYPEYWIEIWLEILDVATYDTMITREMQQNLNVTHSPATVPLTSALSKLADGILRLQRLKALIVNGQCSEWQAKYALFIARAQRWSGRQSDAVPPSYPAQSNQDRRTRISSLKDVLRNYDANSAETTAELSAMMGFELIQHGQLESGEAVLKNAIRISLHTKSLLLQILTLVGVHRLYDKKDDANAKLATKVKHEKKLSQFRRRVSEAIAETPRNEYLLKWVETDLKSN
uniref:Uncharacterized protein AlNc14C45G3662 n=1 Tax=Albugo laibachii Nc14 TaxID=890382 RepID=F0WAD2_9STRA|nr:conserved hypothetical protein [Albugo laibachii Nc14]|eukprot:CCA18103.1 conserved hypothetical protein [Albugo laibachii Nc14]